MLDALTDWRYLDGGERCTCSCRPQLPDTDRHNYGFGCICVHSVEDRRDTFQRALNDIRDLWHSPDDEQARSASQVAEAALQDWLTRHPGVVISARGGFAPEQWRGEIDGHSFYLRERQGDWHIEIDLHPTGHFIEVLDGHNASGRTQTRQHEIQQGDVIASGTTDAENYGTTVVQRAQFVVTNHPRPPQENVVHAPSRHA